MPPILRLVASLLLALIVLLAAVIAWLAVPGLERMRTPVLAYAVRRASSSLPGSIEVAGMRWPRAGRIELTGIRWTRGRDTLADVRRFAADIVLVRLLDRDLVVRELSVDAPRLDLVGIREVMPPPAAHRKKSKPFLRDGPIPGVPSFGVAMLHLDAASVRVDTLPVPDRLALDGSIRLLHGGPPLIDVHRLTLDHPAARLSVDPAHLTVDLSGAGRIEAGGQGRIGRDWPFTFSGRTANDGTFRIALLRSGPAGPNGPEGLEARGRIERDGWKARGVDVEAFSGRLRDLIARGSWRARDGRNSGLVHLEMHGTRWLSRPAGAHPDTLELALDARLSGPSRALDARIEGRAAGHVSGLVFDRTRFAADGVFGDRGRLRFALVTRAQNLDLSGTGELRRSGDTWELRLPPVRVDDAASPLPGPSRMPAPPAADARFGAPVILADAARQTITVRELRITGGFGEGRLNARLERGTGDFTATLAWPGPPTALLARLKLAPAKRRALESSWYPSARYHIEARGRLQPRDPRLVADVSLLLPGPAALAPLLPPGARVSDLGPIAGTVRFRSAAAGWTVTADLDRTHWVERMELAAHQDSGAITLDHLDAALPGLFARVQSAIRGANVEGTIDARIRDASFLARFAPALQQARLRAAIQGRIHGPQRAPDAEIAFIAAAATSSAVFPQCSGSALLRGGRLLVLDAVSPHGARLGTTLLDTLRVHYRNDARPAGREPLPGLFTFFARGSGLIWAQAFRVRTRPTASITTETLDLALSGKDLHALRPFRVTVIPQGFEIDSLRLQGTMGRIEADGRATRQVSQLRLTAVLDPPALPPSVGIPPGLLPNQVVVRLDPSRNDSLELAVEAHGLEIASRKDLVARVRLLGHANRILATMALMQGGQALIQGSALMPGRLAVLAPPTPSPDGPLDVTVSFTKFPLPPGPATTPGYLDRGELARAPMLDGNLRLRGTGRVPEGTFAGAVTFPQWRDLRNDRVEITAQLESGAPAIAPGATGDRDLALATAAAGLRVRIVGLEKGRTVLQGDVSLPLRVSLQPARAQSLPGRSANVTIESPGLPLAMLEPFAPMVKSLGGTLELHAAARGTPTSPTFDARASTKNFQASLAGGTRLAGQAEISVAGTLQRPVVRGKVQVDNGVIQLPAEEKTLYPTQGRALLWQGRGTMQAVPPDSVHQTPPPVNTARMGSPPIAAPGHEAAARRAGAMAREAQMDTVQKGSNLLRALDLQLHLVSLGATRIAGRGIDVHLSGDITLSQSNGVPTLLGSVETPSGSVQMYGRRMEIREGSLTFYGDRRMNPSLDVTLGKRSKDVDITAHVTGTARQPQVAFASTPSLDMTDIMSYLVFDRPARQLDQSQTGSVQGQATSSAASVLAGQLSGKVSESLGLDVLQYEPASGDTTNGSGGATVTAGKYVTPQLLVKIAHDVNDPHGFDVSLDYWLRRGLEITTHSQVDRQGATLDWRHDY